MHKIEYKSDTPPQEFQDINECIAFIQNFEKQSEKPSGIFIYNSRGESISALIGAGTTAFVYYPAGYTGSGTYTSKGNNIAESDLSYWLCDHHTEATKESQVPRSMLESVIEDFLENGGKSGSIEWKND